MKSKQSKYEVVNIDGINMSLFFDGDSLYVNFSEIIEKYCTPDDIRYSKEDGTGTVEDTFECLESILIISRVSRKLYEHNECRWVNLELAFTYADLLYSMHKSSCFNKVADAIDGLIDKVDENNYQKDLNEAIQRIFKKVIASENKDKAVFGYVYIAGAEGKLKIGKSRNPKKRIRGIENAAGLNFDLTFISDKIENYSQIEKEMHIAFKDERIKGEWFSIDFNDAVKKLKELTFKDIDQSKVKSNGI